MEENVKIAIAFISGVVVTLIAVFFYNWLLQPLGNSGYTNGNLFFIFLIGIVFAIALFFFYRLVKRVRK